MFTKLVFTFLIILISGIYIITIYCERNWNLINLNW